MSGKTIVIGDIHGHLNLLEPLINEHGKDNNFIFLGDYIDRGDNTKEVIDLILSLPKKICIMGNHEELFIKFLKAPRDKDGNFSSPDTKAMFLSWLSAANGGSKTLKSLGLNKNAVWHDLPEKYRDFLSSLIDYYEDEYAIFVHAGIDPKVKEMKNQKTDTLRWTRSLWLYARNNWKGKNIYFGHTITSNYPELTNRYGLFDSGNTIGLDTGSYFTGVLSSLVLEKGEPKIICKCIKGKIEKRDYLPDLRNTYPGARY